MKLIEHHKHIRWKAINRDRGTDLPRNRLTFVEGHDLNTGNRKARNNLRRGDGTLKDLLHFIMFTLCLTASPGCTTATQAEPLDCQPSEHNYTYEITTSSQTYRVQNLHFMCSTNYTNAEEHCHKNNMYLPMTLNNEDFAKLTAGMQQSGQTSTWFGMQRVNLTASRYDYLWLDNKKHDIATMMPKPSEHRAMECGRIRLTTGEVSNIWCGTRNHGAICEFNGSCPAFSSPYNCYHGNTSEGSVYLTFHCAVANWFAARAICQYQGGDLAVFEKKTHLSSMIKFIQTQTQKDLCDDYWVGLRRATWEYNSTLPHEKEFYPMWHIDQPNGYKFVNNRVVLQNCAVSLEQDGVYGWRAENCGAEHQVTCQKITVEEKEDCGISQKTCLPTATVSEPSTNTTKTKDEGCMLPCVITISFSVAAALIIIFIMVAVVCYILRRVQYIQVPLEMTE